ncbi:MAG: hypothetical protein MUF52_14050 [Syntrophobacteraceae bacterium]|jgi:hypothetical protein|nr:hypothetical protein [Syntrophobacteraceae bacterium]
MTKRWIVLMMIAGAFMPVAAGAVSDEDFKALTTQNLLNLCGAPTSDPLYREAHNFCQGYLVGAYHYYMAANEGPDGDRLVCFGDPPPSRKEAISLFMEWAKARPEYWTERPVETQFRFLTEKWPCKR